MIRVFSLFAMCATHKAGHLSEKIIFSVVIRKIRSDFNHRASSHSGVTHAPLCKNSGFVVKKTLKHCS